MKTNLHTYKAGDEECIGYVAWPDADGPRPVVMVAHAWAGRTGFEEEKARKLAELGYIGFATDVYTNGIQGESIEDKSRLMTPLVEDRALLQTRIRGAYDAALALDGADTGRLAGIGYCFGGLTLLDLVRGGAQMRGIVAFHAALGRPPFDTARSQAKVLALHGDQDPMVPREDMVAFMEEMTQAGIDWQLHAYGHAMHSFTNPAAQDPDRGMQYHADFDRRSWQAMANFLQEVLA